MEELDDDDDVHDGPGDSTDHHHHQYGASRNSLKGSNINWSVIRSRGGE